MGLGSCDSGPGVEILPYKVQPAHRKLMRRHSHTAGPMILGHEDGRGRESNQGSYLVLV